MKPLQSVAMGLVIIALSARFAGYDALADPVGWVLVALGVARLPAELSQRGTLLVYAPLVLVAAGLALGLVAVWVLFTGVFMGARLLVLVHRARGDAWLVTGTRTAVPALPEPA